MPPFDPLAVLQAMGYIYLWCLLALAGVCAAAAVIGALMGLRRGQQ